MNTWLITGTTTSGKSTQMERLKKLGLPGVMFVEELARTFLEANPGVERDPNLQDILYQHQIEAELAAERAGARLLICDRGIPDNIGHALFFNQLIKPEWIEWSQQRYHRVFFTAPTDIHYHQPTELQLAIDPNRDWVQWRNELHTYLLQALELTHLDYEFLAGTIDERFRFLERELRSVLTTGPEGQTYRSRQERK